MRRLILVLLLLCLVPTTVFAVDVIVGPGATTVTCIDWDADGYGTGEGCLGADADDSDDGIQTYAHVISAYPAGTAASDGLSVFLSTVKGYTPTDYYYVSLTGDDNTGTVNDPSLPWATMVGLRTDHSLMAGDIVLVKGGTYTDNWTLQYPTTSGASGNPVVFMAYPGEKPIWDLLGNFEGDPTAGNNFLTFDGINFTNSGTQLGRTFSFGADSGTGSEGIIIRNCEVWDRANGVFSMQGMLDWIIEKNVFRDTDGAGNSHGIYLGSRQHANDNIIVRGNLLYNVGLTCAQMNGATTNYEVSGNVCYNFKNASGFSLEMGVMGAKIYNNLVFNGTRTPLAIYNYPHPDQTIYTGVMPKDQTDNMIENNTLIVPEKIYYSGDDNYIIPNITFDNTTPQETEDIYTNTVRNNLLINNSGGTGVMVKTIQATYTPGVSGVCNSTQDYIDAMTTHTAYKGNGVDPESKAQMITMENNLFYSSEVASILLLYNIAPTCNTPLNLPLPSDINTTLNWSEFEALSENYTNNVNEDPLVVDNDADYYNTPELFNFRVGALSPAIEAGASSSTVTTDITGITRVGILTIGAYQGTGSEVPTFTGSTFQGTGSTFIGTGTIGVQ